VSRRPNDPEAPLAPDATRALTTKPQGVYRRILRHMGSFRRGIFTSIGFAMAASGLQVLNPWPIKFIIDDVLLRGTGTTADRLTDVAGLSALYLVIVVAGVLAGAASFYAMARTALYMIHDLRSRLVSHMRSLSLRFHASQSVGDSIWRAINDARSIQEVLILGVRTWAVMVFRLVLMVGLMVYLDPLLTVVALLAIPPLVLAIRRLTRRIQSTSLESRERMSQLTAHIEQTMVAIRAVQVFGKEGDEQSKFAETSLGFVHAQLRFRVWEQLLNVATVMITGLGSAAVLLVASRRVIAGELSVGSLWIFVSYMQSLYQMMNEMMFVYGPFQDAVVGVGRAFEVLDEVPEIRESPDAVELPAFAESVSFRAITFAYEEGRIVLDRISLEVRAGEQVALVGETGSGKTTLLSLVPRLYECTSGSLLLDGVDIRDLRVASLRGLISMVPQEPLLFAATVRENILYGRLDATPAEVEEAARLARAADFIEALPQKYDTPVGERGVKLSVGQQQRISIARAFLKDAPILLLDEPTSALDLRTEADFLEGLGALMAGRTVFIVAHRLSTIRNVDRIYFLEDGRIAESGSHEELMAARGRYHDLFQRQFGHTPALPTSGA
jgi:ABC-type multidrug transport system fused ATPase/permease subunit